MNMKRIATIAVLVFLAVAGQVALVSARPLKSPVLEEGILSAFGGLRSIAAEIIWFRADRLQEEGRYVELAQLAHALAMAEPHTPEIWSYAAWNLAYNVSVMMATNEDRWRWVKAALVLLRDEGLRLNPGSAELHREISWLFELKIGGDTDDASSVYRKCWREIVEDVESRGAWSELGMEPMLMTEIEQTFDVTDRADPQYSALYWAYKGLKSAKGYDVHMLAEIVRQSCIIYRRKHPGGANG